MTAPGPIKCVVWDIDNTLIDGAFLESGQPAANPAVTSVLAELADRGILHALASRNPPDAAGYVERVTGHRFAATVCGWGRKSEAIRQIGAELGLATATLAFVDDDALERAEVSFAMPEVTVLAPEDMTEAAGWPRFSPAIVTDEASRRGQLYLTRQRRQEEARAFGGSRDDFLRYCRTRVAIAAATASDLPRLHELSVRTSQFNSAGAPVSEAALAGLLASAGHRLVAVRLADRYGDDGVVGGCVIAAGASRLAGAAWEVPLLMMSCRAMGRGVIDALLAWVCLAAARAGASRIAIPCVVNQRNVPLRIALTGAGFRADPALPAAEVSAAAQTSTAAEASAAAPDHTAAAGRTQAGATGRTAVFARRLDGQLPELPDWAADPAAAP